MEKIYLELKTLLKRIRIYLEHTFLESVGKRRVFLEDKYDRLNYLQVKQVTERLINEGKDTIVIGDDLDEN